MYAYDIQRKVPCPRRRSSISPLSMLLEEGKTRQGSLAGVEWVAPCRFPLSVADAVVPLDMRCWRICPAVNNIFVPPSPKKSIQKELQGISRLSSGDARWKAWGSMDCEHLLSSPQSENMECHMSFRSFYVLPSYFLRLRKGICTTLRLSTPRTMPVPKLLELPDRTAATQPITSRKVSFKSVLPCRKPITAHVPYYLLPRLRFFLGGHGRQLQAARGWNSCACAGP